MALLVREGDVLRLELSFWEKIGAFHSSPHAPLSALESVTYYKSPWSMSVLRGVRAPGTGFPFVILLGTMQAPCRNTSLFIRCLLPVGLHPESERSRDLQPFKALNLRHARAPKMGKNGGVSGVSVVKGPF
jgi:hypothetical protein